MRDPLSPSKGFSKLGGCDSLNPNTLDFGSIPSKGFSKLGGCDRLAKGVENVKRVGPQRDSPSLEVVTLYLDIHFHMNK